MGDFASYLQQQQSWAKEQREAQLRLQALDQARIKGVTQAKAEEASVREIMKVRSRSTWAGLKILAVVSLVILMFAYNQVFAQNKQLFWVLTTVLVLMLIYKFVEVIREDGGLAVGHLSS